MATKKKSSSRKSSSKKSSSRKKSSTKRSSSRKTGSSSKKRSSSKSSSGRKYGPKAQEYVKEEMHEMKHGKLRSGRSGKKVTSRKQAIAIGLSEARRHGAKVPANTQRKAA